jgi:hypothetical protein
LRSGTTNREMPIKVKNAEASQLLAGSVLAVMSTDEIALTTETLAVVCDMYVLKLRGCF